MKASLQIGKVEDESRVLYLQTSILMALSIMTKRDRGLATYFIKCLANTLDFSDKEYIDRVIKELDRLEIEWEIL